MRNFSNKICGETKKKTRFMVNNSFPKNRAICELMWKNTERVVTFPLRLRKECLKTKTFAQIRYEIRTGLWVHILVFSVMTPYDLVGGYPSYGGLCLISARRRRQFASPVRCHHPTSVRYRNAAEYSLTSNSYF
jgi:hypothetical protein